MLVFGKVGDEISEDVLEVVGVSHKLLFANKWFACVAAGNWGKVDCGTIGRKDVTCSGTWLIGVAIAMDAVGIADAVVVVAVYILR